MKTIKYLLSALILMTVIFTGCDASLNTDVYNDTVGKKLETIAPAEVSDLAAKAYFRAAVLSWVNPEDKDFYGFTIQAVPAEGSLENPVTFMNKDSSLLPSGYTVKDLSEDTTYTFIVQTFDDNMNFSDGLSISIKPEGETLIVPDSVTNLEAITGNQSVTLNWENPDYENLFGITISCTPAFGNLTSPITFMNNNREELPDSFEAINLPGNISYTFSITAFDKYMNYSVEKYISAKPDGENSTETGNFYGTDKVFSYKKDKSAFDFGYCSGPVEKDIDLYAKIPLDTTGTVISTEGKIGNGTFELISVTPEGPVKTGGKFTVKVKYTPSSSPCWDEGSLYVSGDSLNTLTLLGSSFKQPNNFEKYDEKEKRNYGVQLWLRADLIGSTDVSGTGAVTRVPDYSGHGFHAYSTDSTGRYLPEYVQSDSGFYKGMPFINFDKDDNTRKSQLMAYTNGSDPIIRTTKGTTTFVVFTTPQYPNTTTTAVQTVVSANYGTCYPTLINTYRYCDMTSDGAYGFSGTLTRGWSVKASGLYGTYRYPCTTALTDDEDTRWFTSDDSLVETSVCMRFEQEKSATAVQDPVTSLWNYPSNISMWINSQNKLLSYIYSNSSVESLYSTTTYTNYGAYGKPVSDGKGHRYGTLNDIQSVSSAQEVKDVFATTQVISKLYKNWNEYRQKNSKRMYDWAYTYSPADYIVGSNATVDLNVRKQSNGKLSLASSDDGSGSACGYFTNWISTEPRRNGTIYNIILGPENNLATYFRGSIAEVIMYDYSLSDEEVKEVNNYIYYRYGIGSLQ